MERQQELEARRKHVKEAPLEDYLSEDPVVYGQNYFILSYLLPDEKNELKFPTIKMRGAFKTQEDCQRRIEKLKNLDPYFNMYVCEVGKFGNLLPEDEIKKMDDIDFQYREATLNEMVKDYQENKDKADAEFEKRKDFLKKRAQFEGSKEGQELLNSKKENPIAVKTRITTMKDHLAELNGRLSEVTEILRLSEEQLKDYSEEEIVEAQQKHKEEYGEDFTIRDLNANLASSSVQNKPIEGIFTSEDPFLQHKTSE